MPEMQKCLLGQKEMIKEYLIQCVELVKKSNLNKLGNYFSLDDFVLQNGQIFKVGKFPKDIRRGEMKQCYRNAVMLLAEKSSYLYVEGYAMGIIPALHAWCIDKKGNVIDPTWPDGKEYFGVIFKRSFTLQKILKEGKTGFIDNWEQGWPLLKLDPKIWKGQLNNTPIALT